MLGGASCFRLTNSVKNVVVPVHCLESNLDLVGTFLKCLAVILLLDPSVYFLNVSVLRVNLEVLNPGCPRNDAE